VNFSALQWLISFALDAFIKSLLIIYVGVLITLGAAPAYGFVYPAIFVSVSYFVLLFLANKFVAAFERVDIHLSRGAKFALVIILANIFFTACVTATLALPARPGDSEGAIIEGLWISAVLVATNLTSILIVSAFGCIANKLRSQR
jgi:hypothetical protein